MRKYFIGLVIVFAFSQQCFAADTNKEDKKGEKSKDFEYVQAEVREWYTFAESSWRISFFHPFWGRGESLLEFDGIDAPVTLATLRLRPGVYWLTLEGTYGVGNIDSGKMTDTDLFEDWIFQVSGWDNFWSESESDAEGDVTIIDTKLSLRLYPREETPSYYLDGTVGYISYRERFRMTDGFQTVPNIGPFNGLDSTYDFNWESYPVGLKAHWKITEDARPWLYGFYINGAASAGPVSYRGEGVWNLRNDFEQDPSFRHESDEGFSILTDVNINYQPIRYVTLGIGYQYFQFEAQGGVDTTFFSDGTEDTADLVVVKSLRHGPYISFSAQF